MIAPGLRSQAGQPNVRPYRGAPVVLPDPALDRSVRRRIGLAWGLLVLNALTFYPGVAAVPIPSSIGKVITQGALPAAIVLALSVNRRVIIRPNVLLCLLCLLVLDATVTCLQPQHFGTVYRTFRLAEFVAALWLLSPWWGRRDLLLVRCHLISIGALLATVLLGAVPFHSHAFPATVEGRLTGAIWPVPATQVAHYAAVTVGLIALLWLGRRISGKIAGVIIVLCLIILLLTHTRTALAAMSLGLLVAGLSMLGFSGRTRRFFAWGGAIAGVTLISGAGFITTWLARGQGASQLDKLTGRTVVWAQLVSFPRNTFQMIFGFGLSNSSFDGLPIDSNWLSSYEELGYVGVCVCAIIIVYLLTAAWFRPRGLERALALFLIVYCLIASFTETGFTDASTYMLDVVLAASLLVPQIRGRSPALRGL
jgi:hypothetical protein